MCVLWDAYSKAQKIKNKNKMTFFSAPDGEEYTDEEGSEEEEDTEDLKTVSSTTGARPRRMSQLKAVDKEKIIPDGTSLFIFSKTNK